MWLASLCVIVLSFARVNVGVGTYTDSWFIFPSAPGPNENFAADLTLPVGSTEEIQWSTPVNSYNITLFQQTIGQAGGYQIQTIYTVESGGAGQQQSFKWQVQTYDSSLSYSPVYFLWLNPWDPQGFTCHYFNITDQSESSQSSSSSSGSSTSSSSSSSSSSSNSSSSGSSTASTLPTPLTTSMIASSTSSTPSQTSSDTAPTPPSTASSSTDTYKVGLGVGLGICLPLFLIAGFWIGIKLVKQRQSSSHGVEFGVPHSQFPDMVYPRDSYPPNGPIHDADQIHEAPSEIPRCHEAPPEGALIELGPREF